MFSISKFEDEILGGIRLPRDVNDQPLIQGTHRRTPYGDLFNVAVVPVDGVGAVTKRRKAPDDATYTKYPVLYDLIPRICVVRVGEDGCYHKAAFALPKFNALTPVDEDDRQEGENDAEVSATSLRMPGVLWYQAQEKANGHTVTFCLLPGASLLLAGTKGCAWLCKLEDGTLTDDAIEGCNPPTEMVRDAFQCMQHLLRADPAGVLAVLRTGRVLVGERETNQHIRYYKTPGVMFFDDDLPEIFKRPETRGPFAIEDITPALLHGLRGGGNSEGWVLCGMDSSGKILIRFKIKTVAYTCLRTARESFDPLDGLHLTLSKWHERIHVRNRFLHVHPRYMDDVVFEGFLAPLAKYMYAQNVTRQDIAFNGAGFAPVIESFRVATGLSDDFHLPPPCNNSEVLEYGLQKVKHGAAEEAKSGGSRGGRGGVLVTTVAMPPGSGKTTFMALAAAAVPGSVHMSQDQYSPHAEKFYEALAMHLESGRVVFLHRSCFNGKDRRRVFGVAARAKASVVAVQPYDSVPPLQLYTALRGVLLRETHETLGEGVSDDVRVLVAGGFWSQCVPVAQTEFSGGVKAIIVPVRLHCDSADAMLMPEVLAGVEEFGREMRARKPFDTKTPLSDVAAYAGLFKRIREGPELRRAAGDVAAEVLEAYHLQAGGGSAAETRCSVLYASIDLDPEHTSRLLADIPREGTTATSADHVTLAYQPSSKQADALSRFLGTRVRVRVRKCVAAPDGGIVACDAEVLDAGELTEYLPEHAHVTVAWSPCVYRPVDSVRLFDGSMPGAVESGFAMEAHGTVKFHY